VLKVTRFGEVTRFDLARTLLGRGHYFTTAYLVDGLLVDSGCPHAAAELVAALAGERVERVVNTHTHEDHIGANGRLQRERGVEVLAHPLALPVLADPRRRQPLHPYRKVMWGWPEPSQARPVSPGEVIATARHRFEAIHTPGHSPEHICLYEPEAGWLFTGDLFVGGRDRALRAGSDVWEIIASLRCVAALGATTLYPGSAKVRPNPTEALAAKLEHLERLGERVLELDRRGRIEPEIVRELCGRPMWIELITLGHFSRRNLVRSYLGCNHDPSDVRWSADPRLSPLAGRGT
jgi:glyoxylase-like metal-dependent hydrolase (beta-lactamase superfamily II)